MPNPPKPKTARAWQAWAQKQLGPAGVASGAREAQALLTRVLGFDRAHLLAEPERVLTPKETRCFQMLVRQRARRVPLQYLLGNESFCGLELCVGPGVLIPRPETEILVETVERYFAGEAAPERIADLGTGSGALAFALSARFPLAKVHGVERSLAALRWARVNRGQLKAQQVKFWHGDAGRALPKKWNGTFDLVVSNPPYIPRAQWPGLQPEVRFEPRGALLAGADGLQGIGRMLSAAVKLLRPNGLFLCEIGQGQAERVRARFSAQGFGRVEIVPDLQRIPRVAVGRKNDTARASEKISR